MRSKIGLLLLGAVLLLLTACGAPSKEDVVKKLSGKWNDSNGYDLQATMEIKTGEEPRLYDVTVWHTKPDFYKVDVSQKGKDESQMIVRNEEGVFVVTPSLNKTYKFQSDWPAQNSQAYLISTLSDDIKADKKSTMTEKEKTYVFETATRNNHKAVLPTQQIHIDKKTLLPTHVSLLDENKEEKIRVEFKKITLGVKRKADDYKVETENMDHEKKEEKPKDKKAELETFYPSATFEGVTLISEEPVATETGTRLFLSYGGAGKEFVVVQEPAVAMDGQVPVSIEGDPVDLGFAVAALSGNTIRWEQDGIAFYVASESLSKGELIQVAGSMQPDVVK
ncbi:LolA family protein [Sporosarcina gallistercoris]|uniref:Outer membrane lipoprotein carrier protein LolA n=1 Tax=Sporosarcina gallistercoris TaxID=2762245 RepID=A0ABR8PGS1_9BACL|nr:outer membrane lipoprotein carrier protein LolA [Sporosarcina gallistercoris]MBD7907363.1 outer membrane lipoprotein carrier protein LolA [Sporosarcina gallistercoris]